MLPISVCIITKNEEEKLGRLLESLKPYGFEIVIVDTGSTDRTKEIAQRYTEKVFDFEWIADFSAARNFAASAATNRWIMVMDADEWIESVDTEELLYFIRHCPDSMGSVWMNNVTGSPDHPGPVSRIHIERLYDRKKYHYIFPVHEQLAPRHSGFATDNLQLNTFFGHDGYCMDEETRIKKAERNRSLLLKQLDEDPGNPYIYYQLGKTSQMAGDTEGACAYFGKALESDLDPELDYVNDMVVQYGESLLELGRFGEALGFEGIKEAFEKTADFVYLMGRIYLENKMYQQALDEFQKALTIRECRAQGCNSYLAAFQIGRICVMAGQNDNARRYLELCGNYPPAVELLKTID